MGVVQPSDIPASDYTKTHPPPPSVSGPIWTDIPFLCLIPPLAVMSVKPKPLPGSVVSSSPQGGAEAWHDSQLFHANLF